ncbi:MAG: hypothetical protein BWY83_02745 [bacterium ADurb.Bin478]|nr:MAG: hypothetical protein BWY83_02745 [bacterium ADurb.Bin478]
MARMFTEMVNHADQSDQKRQSPQTAKGKVLGDKSVGTDGVPLADELPGEIAQIHFFNLIVPEKIHLLVEIVGFIITTGILFFKLPFHGQARISSRHQSPIAVLFAIQVLFQLSGSLRIVFIDLRIQSGADVNHRIGGVADQHQHQRHKGDAQIPFLIGHRPIDGGEHGQQQQQQRPESQAAGHHRDVLDHARIDDRKDRRGHKAEHRKIGQADFLAFFIQQSEIDDERDGGQRQDHQQVDADGQTDQIGDDQKIAVRIGFIGFLQPNQNQPDDGGGEQGADGIDFGFHGVEPQGIGKSKGQTAQQSAADEDQQILRSVGFSAPLFDQADDDQIGQHDRERRGQSGDRVDAHCDAGGKGQQAEQPPDEQIKRRTRWMGNAESV